MAPMRWQGGEKAPSRKSSLPCRLILNWPDPFIGTGTLKKRHIGSDSKIGPLNDHIESFALAKQQPIILIQRAIKASLDVFIYLHCNYIQVIGTFHVLN